MPGLSSENTNGLLRQNMPTGTDPSKLSAHDLAAPSAASMVVPARPSDIETIRETCRASCAHPLQPDVPVL